MLLGSLLFWWTSAYSQVAPSSEETSTDDDIVELSPFEVRSDTDVGYVATNTLAGSRLNTQLRFTPAAISVMTKELLQDIGAVEVNDAIEYALGAENSPVNFTGNAVLSNDFNYQFRGFEGAGATRDYFTWRLSSDMFNIERLDFVRGPNAILFGVGGPGGIVNTTPKRALPYRQFGEVELRIGTWKERRAAIDYNLPVNDQLAVRANVVRHRKDGFAEFAMDDHKRGALAITWRPTETTTVRFDGEMGEMFERRVRPWPPYYGTQWWDEEGQQIADDFPPSAGPPFQGVPLGTFGSGANIGILNDGPLAFQPANLNVGFGGHFRVGSAFNVPGLNNPQNHTARSMRRVNPAGPHTYADIRYRVFGLTLEQRIGEALVLEATATTQRQKQFSPHAVGFAQISIRSDASGRLPTFGPDQLQDGSIPNPNAGEFIIIGQYSEFENEFYQDDYRLTGTYRLDLGNVWGIHRLVGQVSDSEVRATNLTRHEVNVSPNRAHPNFRNGLNRVTRITYIDLSSSDPNKRAAQGGPHTHPIRPGPLWNTPFDFEGGLYNQNMGDNLTKIRSFLMAAQSRFWDNRIHTTVGVRRDHVRTYGSTQVQDPVTFETLRAPRNSEPSIDTYGTTKSIGGVFQVTDWLGIFANRSDSFQPNANVRYFQELGQGGFLGHVSSKGTDIGIKLSLLEDRISAQLGWFDVKQENQVAGQNGLYAAAFSAMWYSLGREDVSFTGSEPRASVADGYELEVTANLTRRWRLFFNATRAENAVSNLLPNVQAYWNANRANWDANRGLPIAGHFGIGPQTVGAMIDMIENLFSQDLSIEGEQPKRFRPWSGNLFTSYAFDEGLLDGITVGVGANYRGDQVLGYSPDGRVFKGNEHTIWNGMVAYNRPLTEKIDMRLQFNVVNLLNYQRLQVLDSGWDFANSTMNHVYYYVLPRRYSLTARFSF